MEVGEAEGRGCVAEASAGHTARPERAVLRVPLQQHAPAHGAHGVKVGALQAQVLLEAERHQRIFKMVPLHEAILIKAGQAV